MLGAIADPISWLSTHAVSDDQRPRFEAFIAQVFKPVLDELGWDVRPIDTEEEKEKRALVLSILGRTAGLSEVRSEARHRIAP